MAQFLGGIFAVLCRNFVPEIFFYWQNLEILIMPKTKSKDKSRLFELTPINEDDIVDQDYIVKQIGGTAPEYSEINN